MFKFQFPLYAPADDAGGDDPLGLGEDVQDMNDLGDDAGDDNGQGEDDDASAGDDDQPGDDEGTPEDDEASLEDEGADDKEDEQEDDEEVDGKKKKEIEPNDRPTVKDIKAKYPNLFKEFPGLRAAFFDYPKFLEVFPDPKTAEEAAAKASEFDQLEGALVGQGDPTLLVATLKENNPAALAKIVENFAPTIRETDPDLYIKLTRPIIEELLYFATKEGEKQGNKNLVLSAKHIANYWSGTPDIPDISTRTGKKTHPAEKQLEEERAAFAKEKFTGALREVINQLDEEVKPLLSGKLEQLTPFERKQVIKETRLELDSVLEKDKAFQSQIKGLWNKAREANYTPESKSRIRRAWLDRAKTLVPGIRNRLLKEALDARTGESNDKNKPGGKKRSFPAGGGQAPRGRAGVLDPSKIDWRKTSDDDILSGDNSKVRLRR